MKNTLRLIGAAMLGAACTGVVFAGSQTFNFDTDPSTDPALASALILGNHVYLNTPGFLQIWSSGAGTATNGNPKTGGYLSITDSTNGNNALVFVFPDIDSGLPIKGFQIDMDLRIGNGTLGRPADGFSISFARSGDIVLVNATNGITGGFAGADNLTAARSPVGSTDVENGTKSGVAVVFDAWQGNYLPDTPPADNSSVTPVDGHSNDREGVAVRVDDRTLIQLNLINNRNWRDCALTTPGVSSIQTNLTDGVNNAAYGTGNPYIGGISVQTGTNALVTANPQTCTPTFGNTDATGSFTNLWWEHLRVKLTNDPNPHLTVNWKGVSVIDTNLPTFAPTVGRLILAGRTGGNNENTHADNITVVTTPTTNAYLSSVFGLLNGFIFNVVDNGPATVVPAGILNVKLDGTIDVTSQTTVTNSAPVTTGVYTQAVRFLPGTFHTATVTWQDSFGAINSGSIGFAINYVPFNPKYVLPLSAVNTSQVGFQVKSYQTFHTAAATLRWAEDQVIGLRGNNLINQSGFNTFWDGPLDLANNSGANIGAGFFNNPYDLNMFGIGIGTYNQSSFHDFYDNSALELMGYIYFPTSGIYSMVMGSDDSFQLSVGYNPQDRMGEVAWSLNGNRLPNTTAGGTPNIGDILPVVVDAPGVYPIRLLWQNGLGQAGLEWYTMNDINSTPGSGAFLVNDTNNIGTPFGTVILTYRSLSGTVPVGAYVKSANPVRDSQNVVHYQPVVIDIADGTGSRTINDGTIALSIDGVARAFTASRAGDTVHIVQTLTTSWASGLHTNVLTFNDNAGTNYNYTWQFTVLGGTVGLAVDDITNTVPTLSGVSSALADVSRPGWLVKPWQSPMEAGQSHSGWAEEQLEGLHALNLASLAGTNGPGVFTYNNLWDMRYDTGTGGSGEWAFDLGDFTQFGIGAVEPAYRISNALNTKTETSALDIAGWFVFPKAGRYIMHVNSDDGLRVMSPQGTSFGKIGTFIVAADVGRGMAGGAGGVDTGGTMMQFNIPTPGAYPFRLIYYNGGTGGGLEWGIYQFLADGSVAKIPVNDPNTPGSIKVYQGLTTGDVIAPYVRFANPVYNSPGVTFFQPIMVELADGPAPKTVNAGSIQLRVDGNIVTPVITTPVAGVTRILWEHPNSFFNNGAHSNVLTYADNAANTYSNFWPFNVVGPGIGFVTIPASQSVPTSQVDHTKPGFRVKSYQTVTGNPNTIDFTEQQFLGLQGPNIADQSLTNGPGFFVWNGAIDFADNGGTGAIGEYRYNNSFGTNFGFVGNGGGANSNNTSLIFAGWMEFPYAGIYTMTCNSDDSFKISFPFGVNPFNSAGITVGSVNVGRGSSGGNSNPFAGSSTPSTFNIPAPGAYPIRLLWENGGGGLNVEWTVMQKRADGSLGRILVNDPTEPDAIKVYQTLNTNPPSIQASFPSPALVNGTQPAFNLGGVGGAQTTLNTTDLILVLQDGSTTINPGTVTLSLNGVSQPITVTNGNGNTTLFRFATNGVWPSGAYGPLLVSFQNNLGQTYTYNAGYIATPFWGTLHGGFDSSAADLNKPGFKVRTYQVDPAFTEAGVNAGAVTTGGLVMAQRVHVAEQVLAGLWGPNQANLAAFSDIGGYFDLKGTGPSNGVVNVNAQYPAQSGDFTGAGFFDQPMPGIPGLGPTVINSDRSNSCALEILALVEFPTNGTYTLGVSSDDGFRLTQGWDIPVNKGALKVNSPGSLAGFRATIMNQAEQPVISLPITNPITGNLVLANGIGFGSTTNGEGCVISNPGALAGNIAIMYRSTFCSFVQQVENAYVAGARAVVIVQKHRPVTDGVFPEDFSVSPMQPIPAVEIEEAAGNALIASLQTNAVNVTLNPEDYQLNPSDANKVLGQTSIGKGNSDCNFVVVATNAPGIYPVRLVYWNGGGGVNVEFYSLTGTNSTRKLVNDLSNPSSGLGLRAFFGLATPTVTISGSNIIVTWPSGQLQSSTDLINWANQPGTSPLTIPIGTAPMKFYRTVYSERP